MKKSLNTLAVIALFANSVFAQTQTQPERLPLAEAVVERLPADYRQEAQQVIKAPNAQQTRWSRMSEEELISVVTRQLAADAGGASFLVARLDVEPSAKIRVEIIRSLNAYWKAHPEEQTVLEKHLLTDADAEVSVEAFATLHHLRDAALNKMLDQRLELAASKADLTGLARLYDEEKQGESWEAGTTLPAYRMAAAPVFSVVPADKAIRVLAFGDFGTGSEAQRQTAAAMLRYSKLHPFDFGLTLGDNFYPAGMTSPEDPRWQTQWEELYGPIGIKFYATLGNHDWAGADSPAAELDYSAKSADWRMPSPFYTFTAGPVQFFAFDTPQVNEAELKWLDEELAKSTATWKVVYGHYHIYSATRGDNKELVLRLLPILKKNHVDVYLNGHDHNLQELKPEGSVHFFVSGGGGAGLYDLNPYGRSVFKEKVNGFTTIEADPKSLKVSFIGTDGQELYRQMLTR